MSSSNKYSPEVRERAVRMVLEHQSAHDSQWAAIGSIAEKIGRVTVRSSLAVPPTGYGDSRHRSVPDRC